MKTEKSLGSLVLNGAIGMYKLNNRGLFFRIEIETTTFCNRKCSYCPNSIHDRGKHLMPMETIRKIISQLRELHWQGIVYLHHYGEPLTDKRLPRIVKMFRKQLPFSLVLIYTNGDFLDEEMYQKVHPHAFFISNHGNLNTDIPNHWNIYIHTQNVLNNRGGGINIKGKRPKKCLFPKEHLVIEWNGNVKICCNDYLAKVVFGNVNKETIKEIWKRPFFRKIRDECSRGDYSLEICKNCLWRSSK